MYNLVEKVAFDDLTITTKNNNKTFQRLKLQVWQRFNFYHYFYFEKT